MLTSFLSEPFCLFLLLLMCISGAASIGNPECIKVLLNNCFTPDPKDLEGMTPLLYAIAAGHTDCAKLLFEYGANIAARDKNQRGSIHLAVENEKSRNVENATGKIGITMYKYSGHTGKDSSSLRRFLYKVKGTGNTKI